MLWPIFVDPEPMSEIWTVDAQITVRLTWLDEPDLPDDLTLRDVGLDAHLLQRDPGGSPVAQLLVRDGVTAVRQGHGFATGPIRVSGCLWWDRYAAVLVGEFTPTRGVVRDIVVVEQLHDRVPDRWVPRLGDVRARAVPDTAPGHLARYRSPASEEAETPAVGPIAVRWELMSEAQYLREHGRTLPLQQWRPRGFVIRLEVASR